MMKRSALCYLGFVLAVGGFAASAGAADSTSSVEATAKMICGGCHDTSRAQKKPPQKSDGAPPPFVLIAKDPKMTPDELTRFLRLPHGHMDNIVLTDREIGALVGYIQSLK